MISLPRAHQETRKKILLTKIFGKGNDGLRVLSLKRKRTTKMKSIVKSKIKVKHRLRRFNSFQKGRLRNKLANKRFVFTLSTAQIQKKKTQVEEEKKKKNEISGEFLAVPEICSVQNSYEENTKLKNIEEKKKEEKYFEKNFAPRKSVMRRAKMFYSLTPELRKIRESKSRIKTFSKKKKRLHQSQFLRKSKKNARKELNVVINKFFESRERKNKKKREKVYKNRFNMKERNSVSNPYIKNDNSQTEFNRSEISCPLDLEQNNFAKICEKRFMELKEGNKNIDFKKKKHKNFRKKKRTNKLPLIPSYIPGAIYLPREFKVD